jgi:Ca2+-binding EF-hand superfamily protein
LPFRAVDGSGALSRDEFERALTLLGFSPSRDELTHYFDAIDTDHSGSIEYEELKSSLSGGAAAQANKVSRPGNANEGAEGDHVRRGARLEPGKPLAGQLSDLVMGQMSDLLERFREWDRDGNGRISRTEFEQAMRALGLNPTSRVRALWSELDLDGSGDLEYDELLKALSPPEAMKIGPKDYTPRDSVGAEEIRSRMRVGATKTIKTPLEQLHDVFAEIATDRVVDVFRAWDSDDGGFISRAEFEKAMKALGVQATTTELKKLFKTLDPDNSGKIECNELIKIINGKKDKDRGLM